MCNKDNRPSVAQKKELDYGITRLTERTQPGLKYKTSKQISVSMFYTLQWYHICLSPFECEIQSHRLVLCKKLPNDLELSDFVHLMTAQIL